MQQETRDNTYQNLARITGQKADDLAHRRADSTRRNASTPRLGDTYFFHHTANQSAGQDLEWAVVERRPDDGNLLVVPLDDFPFVGSRDIELPESSLGGVAHARCDVGAWLEPTAFRSEHRTGLLGAEDLEKIRERRRMALEGRLRPSLLEDDADADPQYQLWRETTLRAAVTELEATPPKAKLLNFPSGPRFARWAAPLAVAASLVLATRLAMTVREMENLERALENERQHMEEITRSKSDLEERLNKTETQARQDRESSDAALGELRASMDQELAQRDRQIDELSKIFREEPHLPPHFELQSWDRSRSGRGLPTLLAMVENARLFVLDLEVEDPEPYLRYRLQIAMKGTNDVIFETDQLEKQGRWLSLLLPSGLFADGTQYEIRIAGLEKGQAVELTERYLVMVER